MPNWAIAVLTAVLAAAATVLFRDLLVEWLRRPNLKIDFEEYDGQKPYILDLFLESEVKVAGLTDKAKFLRLKCIMLGESLRSIAKLRWLSLRRERKNPLRHLSTGLGETPRYTRR